MCAQAFEQQLYDLTDTSGKQRKLKVKLRKVVPRPTPTLRLTFRVGNKGSKDIRAAISDKHKQKPVRRVAGSGVSRE